MKIIVLLLTVSFSAFSWTHVGNNIHGWKQNPVTIYVNSQNCSLSESEIHEIVDIAMTTWNGVGESSLVVKRGESSATVADFLAGTVTELPVILCDPNFSNQVGASGANVIPAATFKTEADSEGNLNYSGILLNSQTGTGANVANLSRGQVELTLAHEIGHALGLGHSSQPEALMYYSLGSKEKAILTEDDLDGISHIYPRNEFSGGVLGCSAVRLNSSKSNGSLPWALLVIFVGQWFVVRSYGRRIKPEQPL